MTTIDGVESIAAANYLDNLGLLVPYNDPNLAISTGTAQQSPFVIAFQRAGIKVLPSIINAVVCEYNPDGTFH